MRVDFEVCNDNGDVLATFHIDTGYLNEEEFGALHHAIRINGALVPEGHLCRIGRDQIRELKHWWGKSKVHQCMLLCYALTFLQSEQFEVEANHLSLWARRHPLGEIARAG